MGHDLLIKVYGEAALDREYVPADYWLVDEEIAGPGNDEYAPSFDTLEELQDWLHDTSIEWHSPYTWLAQIGRLSGYDGTRVR